ncbi:hypothetical protein [Streptomyces chryseus]
MDTYVAVELWGAPRSETEARRQKERMIEYGVWDERADDPVPELGTAWFAVVVMDAHGGKQTVPVHGLWDDSDERDGMGFVSYEFMMKGTRMTVGHVGPKVKRVEFEYADETAEPELHKAAGFKNRWFTLESRLRGAGERPEGVRVYDRPGGRRDGASRLTAHPAGARVRRRDGSGCRADRHSNHVQAARTARQQGLADGPPYGSRRWTGAERGVGTLLVPTTDEGPCVVEAFR